MSKPAGLRGLRDDRCRSPAPKSAYARTSCAVLAAWAVMLAGCAPGMLPNSASTASAPDTDLALKVVLKTPSPPPDPSLLLPQGKPDCEFRGPLSNPMTTEEMRMKLDYEHQCYRQAESIVRARLQQVEEFITVRSAVLPAPDCQFTGPLSSPVTAEETRTKLEYESQCYRQAELTARARLKHLQDAIVQKTGSVGRRKAG